MNLHLIVFIVETDLMTEIEKLTEEKHFQCKTISQLEQTIQKLSNHILIYQNILEYYFCIFLEISK